MSSKDFVSFKNSSFELQSKRQQILLPFLAEDKIISAECDCEMHGAGNARHRK